MGLVLDPNAGSEEPMGTRLTQQEWINLSVETNDPDPLYVPRKRYPAITEHRDRLMSEYADSSVVANLSRAVDPMQLN